MVCRGRSRSYKTHFNSAATIDYFLSLKVYRFSFDIFIWAFEMNYLLVISLILMYNFNKVFWPVIKNFLSV